MNRPSIAKGFTPEKLAELQKTLAGAFDIKFVFNKFRSAPTSWPTR